MPSLQESAKSSEFYMAVERLMRRFNIRLSTTFISNVLAVVVGVLAGLGAVGFRYLIEFFQRGFFGGGERLFSFFGEYYVILVPAAGGLFVGPLVYFFAREAKGHGVPEVMENVALRGGRIRARVAIVKSLASSICIGSGGSVGREGPIVQIGSSLGSSIGQLLKLRPGMVKGLLACGAAGGISATFNAPLGGVIFALEVIHGNFNVSSFVSIALASLSAMYVALQFFGPSPAFEVAKFTYQGAQEIPFYLIMGVLGGFVAYAYVRTLYFTEDLWDRIKFPEALKPVLGGFVIGGIGVYYPQIFGVGYGTIEEALHGQLALSLLATLVAVKIIATSLTIGSGGSGGIFAPSLFIGAMFGGAFGKVVLLSFPNLSTDVGGYSLVGMGVIFAAAAQAPISSIIILFELTDYSILILPIMLSCSVGYLTFRWLSRESIYTMKLIRRGVDIKQSYEVDLLKKIYVKDIMNRDVQTVSVVDKVRFARNMMEQSTHHGFPVLDQEGRMVGIVCGEDVRRAVHLMKLDAPVSDVMVRDIMVAYPDETLNKALARLGSQDLGHIPVVERDAPDHVVGIITRTDIIEAYKRAQIVQSAMD